MYVNVSKNNLLKKNKGLVNFLKMLQEESKINTVGFYDLHDICEKNNIKLLQKKEVIIDKIKRLGYNVSETHFKGEGIRSNISSSKLVNLLKNKT